MIVLTIKVMILMILMKLTIFITMMMMNMIFMMMMMMMMIMMIMTTIMKTFGNVLVVDLRVNIMESFQFVNHVVLIMIFVV